MNPTHWRVGRKVGRTIYDASENLIGVMDTRELARLAAAAPQLLEACKAAHAMFAMWVGAEYRDSEIHLALSAAITKAMGGDQ